jgi:hypothetical protein
MLAAPVAASSCKLAAGCRTGNAVLQPARQGQTRLFGFHNSRPSAACIRSRRWAGAAHLQLLVLLPSPPPPQPPIRVRRPRRQQRQPVPQRRPRRRRPPGSCRLQRLPGHQAGQGLCVAAAHQLARGGHEGQGGGEHAQAAAQRKPAAMRLGGGMAGEAAGPAAVTRAAGLEMLTSRSLHRLAMAHHPACTLKGAASRHLAGIGVQDGRLNPHMTTTQALPRTWSLPRPAVPARCTAVPAARQRWYRPPAARCVPAQTPLLRRGRTPPSGTVPGPYKPEQNSRGDQLSSKAAQGGCRAP